MTSKSGNDTVSVAHVALMEDFKVDRSGERMSRERVARLCRFLLNARYPLVYTAFDGDHFALTPLMRRHCLRHGAIPADPESILGYRDTVENRITKRGVLRDDLAVLRSCDELWIFTDLDPTPQGLSDLAEGVRVELSFFLRLHPQRAVKVVSVSDLLQGNRPTVTDLLLGPSISQLIDPDGEIGLFLDGPDILNGAGFAPKL